MPIINYATLQNQCKAIETFLKSSNCDQNIDIYNTLLDFKVKNSAPVYRAIYYGLTEILDLLLRTKNTKLPTDPMLIAIDAGRYESVVILLNYGFPVELEMIKDVNFDKMEKIVRVYVAKRQKYLMKKTPLPTVIIELIIDYSKFSPTCIE